MMYATDCGGCERVGCASLLLIIVYVASSARDLPMLGCSARLEPSRAAPRSIQDVDCLALRTEPYLLSKPYALFRV